MGIEELLAAARHGVRRLTTEQAACAVEQGALGLHRATDLAGGVDAWQPAGLPLHAGPADVRR